MDKKELIKKLKARGYEALSGLSTKNLKELYEGTYNQPSFKKIFKEIIGNDNKKYTKYLNPFYFYYNLRNVRFPEIDISYKQWMSSDTSKIPRNPNPFGNVKFFKDLLVKKLGEKWDEKILKLNANGKPADISGTGVKRLGIPGRQGTVVLIKANGIDYAIKVAPKSTGCGKPYFGNTGYLKQAVIQQYASEWKITPPVYAVHCDGKSTPFMVMPALKSRLVDVYSRNSKMSLKHQKQWWDIVVKMATEIGICHCDGNCLNVMIDENDDLKLIDWDRAKFMTPKFRLWPAGSLGSLPLHGCHNVDKIIPNWLLEKYVEMYSTKDNRVMKNYEEFKKAKEDSKYRGQWFAGIMDGSMIVNGKRNLTAKKESEIKFLKKLLNGKSKSKSMMKSKSMKSKSVRKSKSRRSKSVRKSKSRRSKSMTKSKSRRSKSMTKSKSRRSKSVRKSKSRRVRKSRNLGYDILLNVDIIYKRYSQSKSKTAPLKFPNNPKVKKIKSIIKSYCRKNKINVTNKKFMLLVKGKIKNDSETIKDLYNINRIQMVIKSIEKSKSKSKSKSRSRKSKK